MALGQESDICARITDISGYSSFVHASFAHIHANRHQFQSPPKKLIMKKSVGLRAKTCLLDVIMNLKTFIDETANRADEILDGCTNPSEARSILLELLATEHPAILPPDRQKIADQVTAILGGEGFFESGPGGAGWEDDDDDDAGDDE